MGLSILTQRLRIWLQPTRGLAIAEACIIGLVAAFGAVCLKMGSGWLGTWRVQTTQIVPVWLLLPTIGMSFGFIAGYLVNRLNTRL